MSKVLVISKRNFVYVLIIYMMIFGPFLVDKITVFRLVDELVAIYAIFYMIYSVIIKKKKELNMYYGLIAAIVSVGMASSLIFNVIKSPKIIFMDLFLFVKPYVLLLMFASLSKDDAYVVAKKVLPVAKLLVVFLSSCWLYQILFKIKPINGPLSSHIELMTNMAQRNWLCAASMLIIMISAKQKEKKTYLIIYLIPGLMGGLSGFGSILFTSVVFFLYAFRENKEFKLKLWQIVLVSAVVFGFAYEDISGYLFNEFAPRSMLIRHGIETAIQYFPLGGGFATYGSEMAARYYSPLYYKYGFNKEWSLSYESLAGGYSTLKDVYLGMIIGQFGFIGLICYGLFMYKLFSYILSRKCDKYEKIMMASILLTICCSMVVSANTTSWWGILLFVVLGIGFAHTKANFE